MAFVGTEVNIGPEIRDCLMDLANSQKAEVRLVERALIVLYAAEGRTNSWIANELGMHQDTVSKWRLRFAEQVEKLESIAREARGDLSDAVRKTLADAYRSGRPKSAHPCRSHRS